MHNLNNFGETAMLNQQFAELAKTLYARNKRTKRRRALKRRKKNGTVENG